MSSTIERVSAAPPRRAFARALDWAAQGLRWWRRAPWMLLLLCLIQLLVESLLQLIPWVGVALSKLVVPILVMGILLGLDGVAQGGSLRFASLAGCLRRGRFLPALGLAALWGFSVFGFQQLCACVVYGWPALDGVLFGHMAAHPELAGPGFARVLILSGLLPTTLFMMAPFLFLFRGASPWQAMVGSVQLVLSNAAAFAWFALLSMALYALMFVNVWAFALVFLLVPWTYAASYAVWRDIGARLPHARQAADS